MLLCEVNDVNPNLDRPQMSFERQKAGPGLKKQHEQITDAASDCNFFLRVTTNSYRKTLRSTADLHLNVGSSPV